MNPILFLDLEVNKSTGKVEEIGFIFGEEEYRGKSLEPLIAAVNRAKYICGHNILDHDINVLKNYPGASAVSGLSVIDTLYLSPLFRPNLKTHSLGKDYQLSTPLKNDPLADARLAKGLLEELMEKFLALETVEREIFQSILTGQGPFASFLEICSAEFRIPSRTRLVDSVLVAFSSSICAHSSLDRILDLFPVELAYVLSLLGLEKPEIITPSWLLSKYPAVQSVFDQLRIRNCEKRDCEYCRRKLDPIANLQRFFGFSGFRRFEEDGELPLQEQAVRSALNDDSFLAIFPTGGGKSLTFQLPAIIRGEAKGALTVVISPLVALMKDQVDGLKKKDILNVVTINGLLDPLQRSEAICKVEDGSANLLYIAPESLRSNTILRLLTGRLIDRFVIDEAHCFSSWGQDFRVDYLYIADFIRLLQERKGLAGVVPVSCLTATARPEVIQDIQAYFQQKLNIELGLYQTHQQRTNLTYRAIESKEETEKFEKLVNLIEEKEGPAIVYVSRVKKTLELSEALKKNGINAAPYNGKMESREKNKVQDAFSSGEIDVIVATSAFGMGVDKDNVSMVLHYEISNSLENYVQEAGRAGRNPEMKAKCVILYNENDLNKHFALLQGTKLNRKEISQIWQGIKWFNKQRISKSALEIAKAAGWDEEMRDLETRVKTALNALESVGYIQREQNSPQIFAKGLIPANFENAWKKVKENSFLFTDKQRAHSERMLQYLFGKTETRVDYMSERLGIGKSDTTTILNLFKEIGVLGDNQDLTATVDISPSQRNAKKAFRQASRLEPALLRWLDGGNLSRSRKVDLREANDAMEEEGVFSSIPLIRNLLRYWEWKRYLKKEREEAGTWIYKLYFKKEVPEILEEVNERIEWAGRILDHLIKLTEAPNAKGEAKETLIEFSVVSIKQTLEFSDVLRRSAPVSTYEQTLLYLQTIEAIDLKDGLLVYYNRLTIQRKEKDNKKQYTKVDYQQLEQHYEKKVEQIHIVGEYAERLLRKYMDAITFTDDYFRLAYDDFLNKYFPKRRGKIRQPLTENKYKEIFDQLDSEQHAVVADGKNQQILVAAGPGSGKTRVLVHKMASLLLMEDIKPEQFLMLAFSRPAANEFRFRLKKLVPGLANHVDIYTYHSFAFNLVGKRGDLEKSGEIIPLATEAIRERNIPLEKVAGKSVVILDEFQDISSQEHDFLESILHQAGDVRVIAAGDDDQRIFDFRIKCEKIDYLRKLSHQDGTQTYFLSRNYRSKRNIVDFSNQFLKLLPSGSRIKTEQPLIAHQGDLGSIRLMRYQSGLLLEPLVESVIERNLTGTTAVLTATNEEALQVATLLQQQGIPAMLISNQQGFSLMHLMEIQAFTELISQHAKKELGFITNLDWTKVRSVIMTRFEHSKNLELTLRIIDTFDKEFFRKYKGDWLENLSSLKIEDFYFPSKDRVLVSTMHKSKGKEFDNVFVLLDDFDIMEDERKRVLYVAITRAKTHLEIHTNRPHFDFMNVMGLEVEAVHGAKDLPKQIVLTCGLRDVNLNFYKSDQVQNILRKVMAGDSLYLVMEPFPRLFSSFDQPVAAFSKKFWARISGYLKKGYQFEEASIDNLVCWKGKEHDTEIFTLLPMVSLRSVDLVRNN